MDMGIILELLHNSSQQLILEGNSVTAGLRKGAEACGTLPHSSLNSPDSLMLSLWLVAVILLQAVLYVLARYEGNMLYLTCTVRKFNFFQRKRCCCKPLTNSQWTHSLGFNKNFKNTYFWYFIWLIGNFIVITSATAIKPLHYKITHHKKKHLWNKSPITAQLLLSVLRWITSITQKVLI